MSLTNFVAGNQAVVPLKASHACAPSWPTAPQSSMVVSAKVSIPMDILTCEFHLRQVLQESLAAKANDLYSITCQLLKLCCDKGILWSCENPGWSFMWQTTPFVDLFSSIKCMSTEMHHCMFGSSRRKLTKLIHNVDSFGAKSQMALGPPLKRLPTPGL